MIMAMALHPEKQRLGQAEIDRIVGPEALPNISHRSQLPYVEAIIKETMRWHPALPLSAYELCFNQCSIHAHVLPQGIARCTTSDNTYKGYSMLAFH